MKHRERCFLAGNQDGKAQPIDEPILTPTGWRAIGELRVGDDVIAGDGSVCQVDGVFPQGIKPVFSVIFDDGASTRCCDDHLWATRLTKRERFRSNGRTGDWTVRSLSDLRVFGGDNPKPQKRAAVPVVSAVQFPERAVLLDPYLVGVLLGDGCLRHGVTSFSSVDTEIIDAVRSALPDGVDVRHIGGCDYRVARSDPGTRNVVTGILSDLGVGGKLSHEKYVPAVYLWNAPAVRLAVLQGLMDTDGSVYRNGQIEFCSTSRQLADDVAFLVRSMGGKVKTRERRTHFYVDGEKRMGRISYRVAVRCFSAPLFRLTRKLNRVRGNGSRVRGCSERILHAIKPAGNAECVCISVTHPSRTYVTRDFIVTHNTLSGGMEAAIHLTGLYPDWWPGRRWDRPITMWAAGITGESTRDNPQRMLLGRPGVIGTGVIPGDLIDFPSISMRRGVPDAVDGVRIKHVSGHTSLLMFKAYDQGREKWQGDTLDLVWFDEEPDDKIYSEGLTRTNATGGMVYVTATPLLGSTEVVRRFYPKPTTPDRHLTQMTIYEAEHYTDETRAKAIASYAPHEREARIYGIPMLGEGRVFPLADDQVSTEPVALPPHWPQLGGMDFGYTHPTAAVRVAWDRDADIMYVVNAYRVKEQTPIIHAAALKAWGAQLPWAWPHDGNNETSAGEPLKKQYAAHGLKMLDDKATFDDDRKASVEAGLMEMLDRMQTGRLKVFSHLLDWFEEFRQYHRKDGKIVKERDDLLDATRYAMMMSRYAAVIRPPRQKIRIYGERSRTSALAG